jgi:hypothetical protein
VIFSSARRAFTLRPHASRNDASARLYGWGAEAGIFFQDEILADIPGATRPTSLAIDRELAGYALADRIVIPSLHVKESFHRDQIAYAKLFMNPYGVELEMFPTASRHTAPSDVWRASAGFVATVTAPQCPFGR